jgi:hypothetical protein
MMRRGGILTTLQRSSAIPGRGWFIAGTVLLVLAAAAHTAGQFTPDEPEIAAGLAAMRGAHLPMGMGMAPSLMDIFRDLAFTMSVTFAALAAMNAVVVWHRDTTASLIRAVTVLNLVWVGAFALICYVYRVPPPLISGLLIWPFFLVAWLRNR